MLATLDLDGNEVNRALQEYVARRLNVEGISIKPEHLTVNWNGGCSFPFKSAASVRLERSSGDVYAS